MAYARLSRIKQKRDGNLERQRVSGRPALSG
jgi:hypothetical protein